MSTEAWTLVGIALSVLGTAGIAVYNSRSSSRAADKTASAAEVTALGARVDSQNARLDVQNDRIDELERMVRGFRQYIADDHDAHRLNKWPIVPLPDELR